MPPQPYSPWIAGVRPLVNIVHEGTPQSFTLLALVVSFTACMLKDTSTPHAVGSHTHSSVSTDHQSSSGSDRFSPPVIVSKQSSHRPSRATSPFVDLPKSSNIPLQKLTDNGTEQEDLVDPDELEFEDWDDSGDNDNDMPSDLRPPFNRQNDSRSQQPLLKDKQPSSYDNSPPRHHSRRSTFHERDPDLEAKHATRKRYTYAAFFLLVSLIAFCVQTETAVYIQHDLKWNKAYCMLYMTHGSWSLLWPTQLLILRIQKWNEPWSTFWRRHVQSLRQTAQMVEHQTLKPIGRAAQKSPVPYMIKMTIFVTCALTVAGGSWYIAVDYTTASDLTAIYNCSAFFAYAFSVPMLGEKLKWSKVFSVAVAIAGVLVVAYGDQNPSKHGSKSGGGAGGDTAPPAEEAQNRTFGNIVIAIGSVLYGFYEVLYKRLACPPDGCSPGRSMIFANTFGSLIGSFTILVLWIPLPILHVLGWEIFSLPQGEAAWMMLISVLANATFSGSFLVLISLTSPVLSSVAALLTIFIVAIVSVMLPPPLYSKLTWAAIVGGILIVIAFAVLCYASYRELEDDRRKKMADEIEESDIED